MKGTWGKRIYGSVKRGETSTWFRLTLTTRNGNFIMESFHARNEDLDKYPSFYRSILDTMVERLESALNHTIGDQP